MQVLVVNDCQDCGAMQAHCKESEVLKTTGVFSIVWRGMRDTSSTVFESCQGDGDEQDMPVLEACDDFTAP